MRKKTVSQYDSLVKKAVKRYQLHPNSELSFNLMKAVISRESWGDKEATSSAGAMGLTQLMPKTAENLGVTDAYDPNQNIIGGTKLMKELIDEYDGNILLALSYYNCKKSAVDWAREKSGSDDPFVFGAWLQKEAREYVPKVMAEMALIVNGQKYAAKISSTANTSQFFYLKEEGNGIHAFEHKVKKGENPTKIARDFNSWDKQNKKDEYKEVSHINITHPNGQLTNGQIKTGQTVHVKARGYR